MCATAIWGLAVNERSRGLMLQLDVVELLLKVIQALVLLRMNQDWQSEMVAAAATGVAKFAPSVECIPFCNAAGQVVPHPAMCRRSRLSGDVLGWRQVFTDTAQPAAGMEVASCENGSRIANCKCWEDAALFSHYSLVIVEHLPSKWIRSSCVICCRQLSWAVCQ